jgi:hypothetical protein
MFIALVIPSRDAVQRLILLEQSAGLAEIAAMHIIR